MPVIFLDAIAFNHDPTSATNDAINLRGNDATPLSVPEWRRGLNVQAADSLAAYSIRETLGQSITILVQLSTSEALLTEVEIRAVSDQPSSQWPWQWPWQAPAPILPNQVLGTVKARLVTFRPDGTTGFQTFELGNVRISEYGVGIHKVVWWWQYRINPSQPWTTFCITQHKIYTILALPTSPWQQDRLPGNTQLPWAEVLDYACAWARGSVQTDRAAARITQAVYCLGPQLIEYNCPNLGAPMYVTQYQYSPPHIFDCTAFLERLKGGIGRGRYVNCSDCAAIVSTFANILGCDLWQSRMGLLPQGFSVNPVQAIGSIRSEQPCGFWTGFGMHEVAWKGDCREADSVFDACLALNLDANPTHFPQIPLVPVNLRFGEVGEGQYRDCLATPLTSRDCEPCPETRQRRIVI